MYSYTAEAGILIRSQVRRALCEAEDNGLVTSWSEPAKGYFRFTSPYGEISLGDVTCRAAAPPASYRHAPSCTGDCDFLCQSAASRFAAWEDGRAASLPHSGYVHPEVPEACTRDCTHEGAPSPDDWDRVTRHTAYLGDIQTDHDGRPYRLHELTGTRYYQDGEVTDRYL